MRIVPNQRQQSDDDIGSDRDAQRVRRDHLTKLKAMLRQRQLPIPTGDKKGAPPGVEARQVNSDIEDLADPFRTLKDIIAGFISLHGQDYQTLRIASRGRRVLRYWRSVSGALSWRRAWSVALAGADQAGRPWDG